jgi:hypothetical protein
MHGNVMDAMAQAIEQSQTVIICMSEQYQKSNYCRAEAHYAFQRQRKIVPVLLGKHYKPDGWLLFLVGQLLYVDFTKYELVQAMTMLFKELKVDDIAETNQASVYREEGTDVVTPIQLASTSKATSSLILSENILEWTAIDVQAWLIDHDLGQMARLLTNCNGRSLVYLTQYIKISEQQQILKLLQTDSLRRTGEDLSLIELSCFRSLMDEQNRLMTSSVSTKTKTDIDKRN